MIWAKKKKTTFHPFFYYLCFEIFGNKFYFNVTNGISLLSSSISILSFLSNLTSSSFALRNARNLKGKTPTEVFYEDNKLLAKKNQRIY